MGMNRGSEQRMEEVEAMEEERRSEKMSTEEELEKEVWQCLNSVQHLLQRREVLHQMLREGWMDITSARYTMGPARISHPLFSLKPQAASAVVDVNLPAAERTDADSSAYPELQEDAEDQLISTPVVFDLVKNRQEKDRKKAAILDPLPNFGDKNSLSQLRRRAVPTATDIADDEKKNLLEIRSLTDDSASDSDDSLSQASKESAQPLFWFGTLVSPHLRSAQGAFSRALDLVVELLNAQNEAVHAHKKVLSLRGTEVL